MCLYFTNTYNDMLDDVMLVFIIIKRRSGINPIPPTVKDRDSEKKQKQRKKINYEL